MTLRSIFEKDDFNPQYEALDLLTSFYCSFQLLKYFQEVIIDKTYEHKELIEHYKRYLYEIGLINTNDDIPTFITGDHDNTNAPQANKNIKSPISLGIISAYMCMNLVVGREIICPIIPESNDTNSFSDWYLDQFECIKDSHGKPTVSKVIQRLRNAVSHHGFKIRIPDEYKNEPDIRKKIIITFYDSDIVGNESTNEFYAKADFGTVEKLLKKINDSVEGIVNLPTNSSLEVNYDSLSPQQKSLFLIKDFNHSLNFLDCIQNAIFNKKSNLKSFYSFYQDFVKHSNRRGPILGLGAILSYMFMNLTIGREISSSRIPNKNDTKSISLWYLDKFNFKSDIKKINVSGTIKKLRNSISHNNFKISIPNNIDHRNCDFMNDSMITFYDYDAINDISTDVFFAEAKFHFVDMLLHKIHLIEYTYHHYPIDDIIIKDDKNLRIYVEKCFTHFTRKFSKEKIKFERLIDISPIEAYEHIIEKHGSFEISKSDTILMGAEFTLDGKPCKRQYLTMPFLHLNQNYITIMDEEHDLGNDPLMWFLHNINSPLFELDKKIEEMIIMIINQRSDVTA